MRRLTSHTGMLSPLIALTLVSAVFAQNLTTTEKQSDDHPWYLAPLELGEYCGSYDKCKAGLFCDKSGDLGGYGFGMCSKKPEEKKSQLVLGAECSHGQCPPNTQCVDTKGGKRCRLFVNVGGSCSDYYRHVCKDGLECTNGKCFHVGGYGASCEHKYYKCRAGFKCSGAVGQRVCKVIIKKGGKCGYKNGLCSHGLVCAKYHSEGHRCVGVMGRFGVCSAPYMVCGKGFVCAPFRGIKRCIPEFAKKGESCGPAFHRKCGSGLKCVGRGNNAKCYAFVSLNGVCSPNKFLRCVNGLICRNSRCLRPLGRRGARCNRRFLRCRRGLHCYRGRCLSFGRRGAICGHSWNYCYPGLSCLKYRNVKRCFRPVPRGYYCAHPRLPFLVCSRGDVCIGKGARARCARILKQGESCEGHYKFCKKPLRCTGARGKRTCKANAELGETCGVGHPKCSKPHICYAKTAKTGVCVLIQGKNEKCGTRNVFCGPNLRCAGTTGKKRCVPLAAHGEQCGGYYGVCDKNLACKSYKDYGLCYKLAGLSYRCEAKNTACKEGLVCAGTKGLKECVKQKGVGMDCSDPYWVCETGLKCKETGHKAVCVKY